VHMGTDPRVVRRGVRFTPRKSHVEEACRHVRLGIPIHERWLPFLPPALRVKAIIKRDGELVS
jgi:hypothetical protein